MKPDRKRIHHWIFLLGILLVIAGIPFSRFLMSSGQLLLSINWILEGEYGRKLRLLRKNRAVLIFLLIYGIHVAGLAYTTDIDYALKDLRIKLPFLALPIIFATSGGISTRQFRLFLMAYVASVLFGSLRSIWELQQGVVDVREISVFISHIRFSLNVCLAILILGYSLYKRWYVHKGVIGLQWLALMWLSAFLFILQAFTGIAIMLVTIILLLGIYAFRQRLNSAKYAMLGLAVLIPLFAAIYIWVITKPLLEKDDVDFSKLEKFSDGGEFYHHDTLNRQTINGHYIWIYLAEDELEESWEARSEIPFDSVDARGHNIRDFLIRYLTSKGLRKDAEGVAALSDEEIDKIESGATNVHCAGGNVVKRRICQILWEYDNYRWTGDPSGHSVLMRYEYWKAGVGIIRAAPLTGVGTGDIDQAFQDYYQKVDSELDKEWRLRTHNQYLTIFATFGVFGFLLFMLALFYPAIRLKSETPLLFIAFILIAFLSMITEDTIESQAGATFVAFFYCYLLFLPLRGTAEKPER